MSSSSNNEPIVPAPAALVEEHAPAAPAALVEEHAPAAPAALVEEPAPAPAALVKEPVPAAPVAPVEEEEEEEDEVKNWCLSVKCSDLALSLDMRHPRVVLNLLRFVSSYNELAPEGEKIQMPIIPDEKVMYIYNHPDVYTNEPSLAKDMPEFNSLLHEFSCQCRECRMAGDYSDSD